MFLGIGLGMGAVLFIVVDLLQTLDRFLRIKPSFSSDRPALRSTTCRPSSTRACRSSCSSPPCSCSSPSPAQRELDALKAAGVSLYRVEPPDPAHRRRDQRRRGHLPGDGAARAQREGRGGGQRQDPRTHSRATCSGRARSGTGRRTRGSSGWRSSIRWSKSMDGMLAPRDRQGLPAREPARRPDGALDARRLADHRRDHTPRRRREPGAHGVRSIPAS